MRLLNMTLKSGSIQRVQRELRAYKERLKEQEAEFVNRLADIGVNVARLNVNGQGDYGAEDVEIKPISAVVNFSVEGHEVTAKIEMSSTPKVTKEGRVFYPHLAVEFGAGIYYNNGNANPYASELGMGVNTFNDDSDAAIDPGYWWYRDENGNPHLSYGTEATMPMYKASLEIIQNIQSIAREVFRNGR